MECLISSVHGSAPKIPALRVLFLIPFSSMLSAIYAAYEGVQHRIVDCISFMNCICLSVLPDDMGSVRQPTLCEPPSSPAPPVRGRSHSLRGIRHF